MGSSLSRVTSEPCSACKWSGGFSRDLPNLFTVPSDLTYLPVLRCTVSSIPRSMERHNWHLMLNIDKHTTSYNIYCPYFLIRSILNIMCDSLNTLCCSFLITRSGFVIMRCRSYKWCSSLIITCCAFINCRATCYFMYSRYNIIRSTPLIIRCSEFITCCGYIFQ